MKIDFSTPFNEKFILNTGVKIKTHDMDDSTQMDFLITEQTSALYGALKYKNPNFDFNIGLRFENAKTELKTAKTNH